MGRRLGDRGCRARRGKGQTYARQKTGASVQLGPYSDRLSATTTQAAGTHGLLSDRTLLASDPLAALGWDPAHRPASEAGILLGSSTMDPPGQQPVFRAASPARCSSKPSKKSSTFPFGGRPATGGTARSDLAVEEGSLGSRLWAGPGTNPPRPTWLPRRRRTRGQAGLSAPTFP